MGPIIVTPRVAIALAEIATRRDAPIRWVEDDETEFEGNMRGFSDSEGPDMRDWTKRITLRSGVEIERSVSYLVDRLITGNGFLG